MSQGRQTDGIVIGGACGFWGEAGHATGQLLGAPRLDVLVYDYLAEITMSLLARARARDPAAGFAADFVPLIAAHAAEIAARGVRVVSNAGGVNPAGCAAALRAALAEAGVDLRVAVVEGDDLMDRLDLLEGAREMFTGDPLPERSRIVSANAYLGAGPIAAALGAGADIVVTGRCADSALALGAAMATFGWDAEDHDLLAAGALAGHLIECGPQATGGNFTDWCAAGDIARIGYPLAELGRDGALSIAKPPGTAGLVTPATVGEQLLYEIGDPGAYVLPDVVCDLSEATLVQDGPDRVRVTGARGRPPTGELKVSVTWADGFRAGHVFQMAGREARAKAEAYVLAGLDRARARLAERGAANFTATSVETFGGAPDPERPEYQEIAVKVAVQHADAGTVETFLREEIGAALATPPGLHFFTGAGRPRPSPVVRLFSCLVPAAEMPATVTLEDAQWEVAAPMPTTAPPAPPVAAPPPPAEPRGEMAEVLLERLAWARSGDKGDAANIGVIARTPALYPWLWGTLTEPVIAAAFAATLKGSVTRYPVPGICAMNIVLDRALGGGGVASLLSDAQGKAFAQRLLALRVAVPADLVPADVSPAKRTAARKAARP